MAALGWAQIVLPDLLKGSDHEFPKLCLVRAVPVTSHVEAVGLVVHASASPDLNVGARRGVDRAQTPAVRLNRPGESGDSVV